jgi:hypothetical protein
MVPFLILAVGGYFGWQYWQKQQEKAPIVNAGKGLLDAAEVTKVTEGFKNFFAITNDTLAGIKDETTATAAMPKLTEMVGKPEHPIQVIGTRHGEKLFEALLSREEMACAEDKGDYYRIPPDLRDLNYSKFVEQGEEKISRTEDYNSHNTEQLDVAGMQRLLLKLEFMQAIQRGEPATPEE